ncbi:hypothetical protein H6F90_10740 [Trichocoleus sp. FACHB-591]|uniref:hypothetical protein n=1 Tax=Trichocoleus sp. FACHB-591 TaxID=2692872 RepID=UPI001684DAA7|nr:hypothetical protein [Trichocoleus sp. FACHB-591]MBD2095631.1 hypothetical protein [Trichocoleus sp. FACHB-591]
MKLAFKPIFRLEIWHDYYLNSVKEVDALPIGFDVAEAIALIPTQECQSVLRNLRWLIRAQPYGAIVLAQIDTRDQPSLRDDVELESVVPIDTELRLAFWLVVRDRNFANYTNLPLDTPSNHIYYFSNRSGNHVGDRLFLTRPLPSYEEGATYSLGQLVSYQNGTELMTLEAIRHQSTTSESPQLINSARLDNGNGPAVNHASPASTLGEWMSLPYSQYVSVSDVILRQGWLYKTILPQATPGTDLQFSLVNLNGRETVAPAVQVPKHHPASTPLPVNLNFTGQQPGYYQLQLDGNRLDEFVLFDPMAGRDALALIEISLSPRVVLPAFQLLEERKDSLHLRPKTYRIHFKNRATRWRYRCNRPHKFTADQLPPYLQIIDAQTYATKHPIGLCHQPRCFLRDGNEKPLPAPDVSMIKPLIESTPDGSRTVTAIFSDTYL